MATTALTEATFEETVTGNDIVLVDWWAAWCGPCRTFAPVFEDAARRHDDIVFAKVDTEAEPRLAALAGIQSIPTLMAFREGVLVYAQAGALPPAALDELIRQVRSLDMDEVHRAVAAERAGARESRDGGHRREPRGLSRRPSRAVNLRRTGAAGPRPPGRAGRSRRRARPRGSHGR